MSNQEPRRVSTKNGLDSLRMARDGELANLRTSQPGLPGEAGVARAETGAELSVQALNDHAGDSYVPDLYPGRLTLFKPRVNYKFYPDPNMGWREVALGGLSIVELSMNPHAMLLEPFVAVLAEELKAQMMNSSQHVTETFRAEVAVDSVRESAVRA